MRKVTASGIDPEYMTDMVRSRDIGDERQPMGGKLQYPPVFVLGPPRAGTTLLGQVIAEGLGLAHIPARAIRLSRYFRSSPPLSLLCRIAEWSAIGQEQQDLFSSVYGAARTPMSLADSDPIWRKVLGDGYLDEKGIDRRTAAYMRKHFGWLEKHKSKPVIDKSVGHSLRIRALVATFPDALFVHATRDALEVAQSVWVGRQEFPHLRWPTPKVRGYQMVQRRSPEEQAAVQQYLFNQDIHDGLSAVSADRILDVDFRQLCEDPHSVVSRVADALDTAGVDLDCRLEMVPRRFRYRRKRKIPMVAYNSIIGYLRKMPDTSFTLLDS